MIVYVQIYSTCSLLCQEILILQSTFSYLGGKCKFPYPFVNLFTLCSTLFISFYPKSFLILYLWFCHSNIRAKPIVLDPGLYLSKKFDLTMTTERRELPTSFKLYTGRPGSQLQYLSHRLSEANISIRQLYIHVVIGMSVGLKPLTILHTTLHNSLTFKPAGLRLAS